MTYDSKKWKSAKAKVMATPIKSDGWEDIASAPKDGTIVNVRRVVDGKPLFEGLASWRTVHFPALPPHPLDGSLSGHEAYDANRMDDRRPREAIPRADTLASRLNQNNMRTDFANHLQTVRTLRQPAIDFIEVFGAPEEIRTPDPQIRSLV